MRKRLAPLVTIARRIADQSAPRPAALTFTSASLQSAARRRPAALSSAARSASDDQSGSLLAAKSAPAGLGVTDSAPRPPVNSENNPETGRASGRERVCANVKQWE